MSDNTSAGTWSQPGLPLYLQVRRRIADVIRTGQWRPGEAIPNERQLCEQFKVSMGTLRKAIDELVASGLLVRQQGRGTFVGQHSQDRYLFTFFHLVGHDGHKEYPDVRFLKFQAAAAGQHAADALAVNVGAPLWHLTNLLSLRGEVVSVDEIFLPAALFPGLTADRLRARKATLYQMYQDAFDITVVQAAERVRSVSATRAQARLLEVQAGSPLLQIIRRVNTFQDKPVELRYSYVNTARCEYNSAARISVSG